MKTVIWWICTIIMVVGGLEQSNLFTPTQNKNSANRIVLSIGDNEPIAVHGHVQNIGGTAISGASVTLTLVGTSTPAYSGTTDGSGNYTFSSVEQGDYHYKVSKTGYYDKTADLSLHVETFRTDTLIAP